MAHAEVVLFATEDPAPDQYVFDRNANRSKRVATMTSRFQGKDVIVTRAGSGIGEATANRFHAEGANVVLNGRRKSKLIRVGTALGGDRYMIGTSDVSNIEDVGKLVSDVIHRFGKIDVVVNNAGTGVVRTAPRPSKRPPRRQAGLRSKG
jgi:NAD(P)-dependent dehydrogenase (short-subunit alcohol dehydrogenase family)